MLDEWRALPRDRRLQALAIAAGDALAIWQRARAGAAPIEYADSVVGAHHVLVDDLPARALAAVEARLRGEPIDPIDPQPIHRAYFEPAMALRDEDLVFPDPLPYAYHAIYNLFLLVFELPGVDDSYEEVVLGQVISAVDVGRDDWLRDWWTRVWDAWATGYWGPVA